MLQRVLIVTTLALALLALAVPSAEASAPPGAWCSNVCGPGVPCSTACAAYDFPVGAWVWVDCTTYDTLYYGGGSCGSAIGSPTGDLDLEHFLASLESLAEGDTTVETR
jgi:hypothetical protein